jgi:hypothetical protein
MTGTECGLFTYKSVPVIFEPPCMCVCICMYVRVCMYYVCMYVRMYICMYLGIYACMYVFMYATHPVRTTHQSGCISDGVNQHNNSALSDTNICTTRILSRGGRGLASELLLAVNICPVTIENSAPSPHLFPWHSSYSAEPHKFTTNFNLFKAIRMEISNRTACFIIYPCFL